MKKLFLICVIFSTIIGNIYSKALPDQSNSIDALISNDTLISQDKENSNPFTALSLKNQLSSNDVTDGLVPLDPSPSNLLVESTPTTKIEEIGQGHVDRNFLCPQTGHSDPKLPSYPLGSLAQQATDVSLEVNKGVQTLATSAKVHFESLQRLDESRELALLQIDQIIGDYRKELDATESQLKNSLEAKYKSARSELEEKEESFRKILTQLQQFQRDFLSSLSGAISSLSSSPELLIDGSQLEAFLRASLPLSMEIASEGLKLKNLLEEENELEEDERQESKEGFAEIHTPPTNSSELTLPLSSSPSLLLEGKTLESAIENGDLELVRALLDRGDDVHQQLNNGYTPLSLAIREGHIPIVSILLDRGASYSRAMLASAIRTSNLPLATLLVEKGADVNEKGNYESLLHNACEIGYFPIVSLLVEAGADINNLNFFGRSPLHEACHRVPQEVASLLLNKGAKINQKNIDGETPLHYAIRFHNRQVASLLIERGANIKLKDIYGNTPLHIASYQGEYSLASLLLEKGANTEDKNNKGQTPLESAESEGKNDVAHLLRKSIGI